MHVFFAPSHDHTPLPNHQDVYQPKGQFTKAKVALCIHNIAFQGRMWEESFSDMGLPASSKAKLAFEDGTAKIYSEKDPLEEDEVPVLSKGKFKKVNWLKGGILSADKVLTVSPNYATEVSALLGQWSMSSCGQL
jgi:granule-bound starch synthase